MAYSEDEDGEITLQEDKKSKAKKKCLQKTQILMTIAGNS